MRAIKLPAGSFSIVIVGHADGFASVRSISASSDLSRTNASSAAVRSVPLCTFFMASTSLRTIAPPLRRTTRAVPQYAQLKWSISGPIWREAPQLAHFISRNFMLDWAFVSHCQGPDCIAPRIGNSVTTDSPIHVEIWETHFTICYLDLDVAFSVLVLSPKPPVVPDHARKNSQNHPTQSTHPTPAHALQRFPAATGGDRSSNASEKFPASADRPNARKSVHGATRQARHAHPHRPGPAAQQASPMRDGGANSHRPGHRPPTTPPPFRPLPSELQGWPYWKQRQVTSCSGGHTAVSP